MTEIWEDIPINSTDIERIIKNNSAHKLGIIDEMDQFLERHQLPRLRQRKIIWIALYQLKKLNQ